MDDMILRYLSGEATDVEIHRLEKWRRSKSENEARFREMRFVWEGLDRAKTRTRTAPPDIDAMIAEAERRRTRVRVVRSRRALLRSPWLGYGLAAAACAAAVFIDVRGWVPGSAGGLALRPVESSTGAGGVVAMTLSDGTYLRVAAGTHVAFSTNDGRREVVMDGRAFFVVSPENRPFVVRTREGEVTVHGTRFEVHAEDGVLRVVVAEGTVELASGTERAEIHAGQVATVRSGGAPVVKTVGDVWPLLDWPGGLLAFQRTPLSDAAAQIERQFGVKVWILDSIAGARRITGSFQEEPLGDVLTTICAVTGVRCRQDGDTVLVGEARK